MAKVLKYKYLIGRRYRIFDDGSVELAPVNMYGRFGERTVQIRVPVSMVPWLNSLLDKIAEIELTRRNVIGNPYNSSLEYVIDFDDELAVKKLFKCSSEVINDEVD